MSNLLTDPSSSSNSNYSDSDSSNMMSSSMNQVLRDLFLARTEVIANDNDGFLSRRLPTSNERPRRCIPLVDLSREPSLLFSDHSPLCSKKLHWKNSDILFQLPSSPTKPQAQGRQSISKAPTLATSFPLSSSFCDNTSLVSLADSLVTTTTSNATASFPSSRRRVHNQASRLRIVGRVLGGTHRAARVAQLVRDIRQAQLESKSLLATHHQEQQQEQQRSAIEDLCQHTVLADAWEMTALNDLKALPWEEMVVTAERHLAAYQAYKQQTSAMASIFSLH